MEFELDANDPAAIKEMMKTIPAGALVAIVLAWGIGAFAGAWVATTRSRRDETWRSGLAIGVLGTAATDR